MTSSEPRKFPATVRASWLAMIGGVGLFVGALFIGAGIQGVTHGAVPPSPWLIGLVCLAVGVVVLTLAVLAWRLHADHEHATATARQSADELTAMYGDLSRTLEENTVAICRYVTITEGHTAQLNAVISRTKENREAIASLDEHTKKAIKAATDLGAMVEQRGAKR